jgi:hypothetical protein
MSVPHAQRFPDAALTAEEQSIVRSVLYASLFEYPLTLAQLRQTLIGTALTPTEILSTYAGSAALQSAIDHRDGFFFPRGQDDLVAKRRVREQRSREFLRRHRVLLSLVAAMPYVRMVALSGSVAHLNLEGEGDLDLFIVTRGRHVWSATVGVVVLAKLLGRRRTVCANFTIADSQLSLDQQDLFAANQIIHLKPLIGMDVYRRFLAANPFVARFYPNFHRSDWNTLPFHRRRRLGMLKRTVERVMWLPSLAVEAFCRSAYRRYLLRRAGSWQSPEQVRLEDDCLKLHTQSHRRTVLDRFEQAAREF